MVVVVGIWILCSGHGEGTSTSGKFAEVPGRGEDVRGPVNVLAELEVSLSSEERSALPDLRRCGEVPCFCFFFLPPVAEAKELFHKD